MSGYRTSTTAGRTLRCVTFRERLALLLVTLGASCLLVAAYAYDGWRALVVVAGLLMLGGGVLLGLDNTTETLVLPPGEEL